MTTTNGTNGDHAVVIGASVGGLLAARVLSDHFARVTVLDRDEFPSEPASRRGVPQGRHTHVLLARGRDTLESLLPGLTDDVVAAGAPLSDVGTTLRFYNEGYRFPRLGPVGLPFLYTSRPLLEHVVRTRVSAIPEIEIVSNRHVLGLTTTAAGSVVTGIRTTSRDGDTHPEEVVEADFVVDASGRSSRSPAWLEELGYVPPEEEQIRVGIAYATRLYRRRSDHCDGDLAIVIGPTADTHRLGLLCANEADRWTLTLGGYANDHPPTDHAGFTAFAGTLAKPDIAEAIAGMEPLTDVMSYRYQSSVRRHYERLRRFPAGYLVFGDALSSFNPIYGQGMSVAALEAETLAQCLAGDRRRLAARFFRQAAKVIDNPWQISAGGDLRFHEVDGRRTLQVRVSNAYMSRLARASTTSPEIGRAFARVAQLYEPPQRLLRPAVAGRVLWANLAHRNRISAGDEASSARRRGSLPAGDGTLPMTHDTGGR